MSEKKRILMLVYGNAHRDPRVRHSAEELAAQGYDVDVFGVALQNARCGLFTVNGVQIYIFPLVNRFSMIFQLLWSLIRGHIPQWEGGTHSSGLAIFFLLAVGVAVGASEKLSPHTLPRTPANACCVAFGTFEAPSMAL